MEVTPKSRNKVMDANRTVEYMQQFTDTYLEHSNSHPSVREAAVLKVQFPTILCEILDDDLFAGRLELPALSFTPQGDGNEGGFGYIFNFEKTDALLNDHALTPENKSILLKLKEYWKTEHTSYKTRMAYPQRLKDGLPSDNWTRESGIAFPLYRIGGTHLDYKKLVTLGIDGLIKEIRGKEKNVFYTSCIAALECFSDCCRYYERQAWEKSLEAKDKKRRKELEDIAVSLRNISTKKPSTLREAIQLSFLYCLVSGSQNYGRIDDYLGEFLEKDLSNKTLTHESALDLMAGYWKIMLSRMAAYDGRAVVGGRGRSNEAAADKLALLAIETAGNVIDILPQLTLRFYKGQNPELYKKAFDVLALGSCFPMLYNDDVNIPSVEKAFDISYEEAVDYLPFGCGEYVLNHKSLGTPSSVLNLLKCLEVTLHKGIDPMSGKKTGIDLSNAEYSQFADLWNSYSRNLEHFVELLAIQEEIEYKVGGQESELLFFSILFDDCLEKGKGILNDGVRYLGGTMETYGNISTADSLTAIKKLVYDQKEISLEELVKALDNDFAGNEMLRKKLLGMPKFGNDNTEADDMAKKVHEHVCLAAQKQIENTGLHNYLVVNINNDANTTLGKYTGASADGRKAHGTMSNGNSPMMGMDKNGVTAMLNSMLKMDTSIHAGAVQNMKFSKEMFSLYREKLEALLSGYFANGGAQAMLTVVGKNDLQNAIAEPEKYQHIIVRVGGFSARFVELSKEVQAEILNRTLYE